MYLIIGMSYWKCWAEEGKRSFSKLKSLEVVELAGATEMLNAVIALWLSKFTNMLI